MRPYLGSHGGDVELLGVDGWPAWSAPAARQLRRLPVLLGDAQLAVEGAIQAAAPEIAASRWSRRRDQTPGRHFGGVARVRLDETERGGRLAADSRIGRPRRRRGRRHLKAGIVLRGCRLGGDLYAFSITAACGEALTGATVGAPAGR